MRLPGKRLDVLLAIGIVVAAMFADRRTGRPSQGTTFEIAPGSKFGRMRVFAEPGDFALANTAVTAVVRRTDGKLVDFWPNRPAAPTVDQLGDTRNIDGLWAWSQRLVTPGSSSEIHAAEVSADGNVVRVNSRFGLARSDFDTVTSYRLERGSDPRLLVQTRITHVRGPAPLSVRLADSIKWGNVTYHGAGIGPLSVSYRGQLQWVGRKGASGDLVLEAAPGEMLHVDLGGHDPGFWPPLYSESSLHVVDVGESFEVSRSLAYRPIPEAPRGELTGRLLVKITDEQSRPLAGKLSFRGNGATPDPDFGSRGGVGGAGRFVWSGAGTFERDLPAGTYQVMATAGPERDAAVFTVSIIEGQTASLSGVLPRLIPTPGWIAADLHLHQAASVDADISFDNRVIAVAAEGVELAVATDHYEVTDLAPTVGALVRSGRLSRPLATMPGSEISTTGHRFGHFNSFPLPLDAEIPYHDVTPQELFAAARKTTPNGVLQVNHPRWDGIGYFRIIELNPNTGVVPESHRHLWADDFDTIEVYNGVDVPNEAAILAPFHDWLNLLSQGHRYTGTGNSDSHNLLFLDPGLPRNMIHWGSATSDDEDLRAPQDAILEALRRGRATVTSGPMVDVSAGGARPGDTVEAVDGRVDLRVRIQAVPWVDVTRLRVFVGAGRTPAVDRAVPSKTHLLRLDETFRVDVPSETFVVALVTGARPLPNVNSKNARPLAFSNPIYVR
jgi:hypothetical protein